MSVWPKVLIIDDVHLSLVHGLVAHNFDVYYRPDATKNEVLELVKDVDFEGLVVRSKIFIDQDFFKSMWSVKMDCEGWCWNG